MLNKPQRFKALKLLKLVVQKVIQVQQTEGFNKPCQTNPAKTRAPPEGSTARRVTRLAGAAGRNPGETLVKRFLPSEHRRSGPSVGQVPPACRPPLVYGGIIFYALWKILFYEILDCISRRKEWHATGKKPGLQNLRGAADSPRRA